MIRRIFNLLDGSQLKELILYLIVGSIATLVEWGAFWLFEHMFHIQYLIATALAFMFSTFANWVLGRLFVFKQQSMQSLFKEIVSIYIVSVVGLLLNLIIMFVLVQLVAFNKMLSKMFATVLVFGYNYLVRKVLIYKK